MSARSNRRAAHAFSPDTDAHCIVADPPWRFSDGLGQRGAQAKYPTLSVAQIQWHKTYWPIVTARKDAVLFLWRVASMQREALDVVQAWGFDVKSEIVWEKATRHDKDAFGMGHYVRAAHETCLICVRGKVRINNHSTRSRFRAPVGRHSEKPAMFFDIVEKLVDGPYVELFSRRQRAGWQCLGRPKPLAEHAQVACAANARVTRGRAA